MRTPGIRRGAGRGAIQVLDLDGDPTCLGFPSALAEAGKIIMLDCQRPCTPQGPDARDCFPFLGGWALPARRNIPSSCSRGGGRSCHHHHRPPPPPPHDHIPAAQTCGTKDFLSPLLLSWQRYLPRAPRRGPQPLLFAQKHLLSSLLLSHFGHSPRDTGPRRGPCGMTPTKAWLVLLLDVCSVRVVGRTRARDLWGNGIFTREFSATEDPCSQHSVNPFPRF